jgi:hypothetical protein
VAPGPTMRETRIVTDSGMDARDWPPPTDAERLAPPPARRKRSRLVLGELIGMPVGVALWVFAMDFIYRNDYRPPPLPPVEFPLTTLFPTLRGEDGSALWQVLTLTVEGAAVGFIVIVNVVVFFCLSHAIARTARWVASTAVGIWVVVAVALAVELEAQMVRLTAQAGG